MELLTRTNASPNLPDYSGRTFLEMVELYLPSYLETFQNCKIDHYNLLLVLDNLQVERLKRVQEFDNSRGGPQVATHYYNPDDEREIKGFKDP